MKQNRLPILTSRKLITFLKRLGFKRRPHKAISHRRYIHPDGRRTTVPVHPGRDIGPGLLRKILKDIKITSEEFKKIFKG